MFRKLTLATLVTALSMNISLAAVPTFIVGAALERGPVIVDMEGSAGKRPEGMIQEARVTQTTVPEKKRSKPKAKVTSTGPVCSPACR